MRVIMGVMLGVALICQVHAQISYTGQKGLYSTQPATRWHDALISGNGIMGIMVEGEPAHERVIFNHEFLYEPIGSEHVEPPVIGQYLEETRKLLLAGKYEEAIKFSYEKARQEGYAGLQWTDPYHPASVLCIDQNVQEFSNYQRSINFETGEVYVTWKDDESTHMRKSFVSRPDNVIVQLIENDRNKVDCNIRMEMQGATRKYFAEHRGRPLGYDDPIVDLDDEWLSFRVNYKLNNRGYEVLTKVICPDGKCSVKGNQLEVKGARQVILLSEIIPIDDFGESQLEDAKMRLNTLEVDYKALLARHIEEHAELFNRAGFDIYPDDQPRHSTEELIETQKANPDEVNAELLETLFYMGRYALIGSSGNNPPNLMGIWNGQWRPAWSGDFTTDANINLQISSANICNLPEAIDSYMLMLERIAPDWEINARNLYGIDGYLAGTRTSGRRNLHTHFNVGFPGHFWLAGAEWLLLPCYEYYQVSGDKEFLKHRLLPMLEKTALFFENFLTVLDDNNHFVFVPSYSPENRPANISVQASINAVMDIAAAKEVFTNLIEVYKELEIKQERIEELETLLASFPPYLINEDGSLKEWAWAGLEDNNNHRHVSHLYPVWPGLEINPEETPELFKAAVLAAGNRKRGNESAHGLTHMALIGARLKKPEVVSDNLRFLFTKDFLYKGLFTSHNPKLRIFNSDALNSFPAVVSEALIFSRPGFIELLPAWDSTLPNGEINNQLCRTRAKVDFLKWNFKEGWMECSITSMEEQELDLMIRHHAGLIKVEGKVMELDKAQAISLVFEKGEAKQIKFSIKDDK